MSERRKNLPPVESGKKSAKDNEADWSHFEQQLHWPDSERSRAVVEKQSERHKEEVKITLTKLQQTFKEKQDKRVALANECRRYTEDKFPRTGQLTYSVPLCFMDKHTTEQDPATAGAHRHKVSSDTRGDSAQSRVERAFRLLSLQMEREGGDQSTMFIMGRVSLGNVLLWLTKETYKNLAPDMICKQSEKSTYYFKRIDERGDPDLIILHKNKGVIIVEVKSMDKPCESKRKGKEIEQLSNNARRIRLLFDYLPDLQIHTVRAFPNLSRAEHEAADSEENRDDKEHSLYSDDLFEEQRGLAESEYDLKKFSDWWKQLPEPPDKGLSPEDMHQIVGRLFQLDYWIITKQYEVFGVGLLNKTAAASCRLIGTLSTPVKFQRQSECSHVRTDADTIKVVGRIIRTVGLNLSDDDKQALREKRVHLQGPPGSGRSTMLVLKAVRFLLAPQHTSGNASPGNLNPQRHVIVVDPYRGALGTRNGLHIFSAINHSKLLIEDCTSRVHHLRLNVNMKENFTSKIESLIGEVPAEYLLFVLDEILPLCLWADVWTALITGFKGSHIWCADGLRSQPLEKEGSDIKVVHMKRIVRIPISVQRVLLQADADQSRQRFYVPPRHHSPSRPQSAAATCETEGTSSTIQGAMRQEPSETTIQGAMRHEPSQTDEADVSTNGPMTVCVRHEDHKGTLLDCSICADTLATLLLDLLKLVVHSTTSFLPCSILVLYSIPDSLYQKIEISKVDSDTKTHVGISENDFKKYADKILFSVFIQRLKSRLHPLSLKVQTRLEPCDEDLDTIPFSNTLAMEVAWTDLWKGVEKDVVIFLPADGAPASGPPAQQGYDDVVRLPGVAQSADQDSKKKTSDGGRPGSSGESSRGVTGSSVRGGQPGSSGESSRGMAGLYWRVSDINRYTTCDRLSLVQSATCCTSQLIMIVP